MGKVLWTSYTDHPLHAKSACEQVTYSVSMVQGWKGGELQGLAQLLYVVHLMGYIWLPAYSSMGPLLMAIAVCLSHAIF